MLCEPSALRPEERQILDLLTELGPLDKEDVRNLLGLSGNRFKQALRILLEMQCIQSVYARRGIALYGDDRTNNRIRAAMPVLLDYAAHTRVSRWRRTRDPEGISFLAGEEHIHLVALQEGEEFLADALEPEEHTRVLFLVPDFSMRSGISFPGEQCLFCTVRQVPGRKDPEIRYRRGLS